jgi:predicted nucleic acid-binding protein
MNAGVLDANVLLRFFLQDDPKQSPAAKAFLEEAEERDVEIILQDATVAEVTFVMEKVYHRGRVEIAAALLDFIHYPFVTVHAPPVLRDALVRYGAYPVDFPDALIAAQAAARKIPAVSFDKDLDRFPDVTRFEPGRSGAWD